MHLRSLRKSDIEQSEGSRPDFRDDDIVGLEEGRPEWPELVLGDHVAPVWRGARAGRGLDQAATLRSSGHLTGGLLDGCHCLY